MRRPRAAFSRARAEPALPVSAGKTAPSPDGGRAPAPGAPQDDVRARSWCGWALSGLILFAIVAVGLYLRVKNNDYGLPYVYNFDEATHFTNRAVSFFTSDFNPGYFQNPSAFSYIVYLVLKLGYGVTGLLPGLEE